jgi:hypothetical protein
MFSIATSATSPGVTVSPGTEPGSGVPGAGGLACQPIPGTYSRRVSARR